MKFVWMFLGFLCLSAIVLAAPVDQDDVTVSDEEWENFKKEHGKNYATKEEEAKRRANYAKNIIEDSEVVKEIPELNDPKFKQYLDLDENELKSLNIEELAKELAEKVITNVVKEAAAELEAEAKKNN